MMLSPPPILYFVLTFIFYFWTFLQKKHKQLSTKILSTKHPIKDSVSLTQRMQIILLQYCYVEQAWSKQCEAFSWIQISHALFPFK